MAKLGVTFTILENASVEGGMDFQGIPHCMLFDHTGKCVYRGSPFSAQEAVVAAVKAAPGSILEGRTLAKLPELNTLLRDERQFATVLKKARGIMSASSWASMPTPRSPPSRRRRSPPNWPRPPARPERQPREHRNG